MKTRKDFILGGIGTLAVPYIGRSEPRRAMLGAVETGEDCSREWVNPYITEGLVSMVDCIENAERGKTRGVLKDIVTGYESYIPNEWIVNDKSIEIISTKSLQFTDCSIKDDFTIEYMVEFLDDNTVRLCALENITGNASISIKKTSQCTAQFLGSNLLLNTVDVGVPFCYSISYEESRRPKAIAYVNGSYANSISFGHSMSGRYGNGFRIGRNNVTTFQKVFGIRIYNRGLAEEEVAFNHRIDVERFGIE